MTVNPRPPRVICVSRAATSHVAVPIHSLSKFVHISKTATGAPYWSLCRPSHSVHRHHTRPACKCKRVQRLTGHVRSAMYMHGDSTRVTTFSPFSGEAGSLGTTCSSRHREGPENNLWVLTQRRPPGSRGAARLFVPTACASGRKP